MNFQLNKMGMCETIFTVLCLYGVCLLVTGQMLYFKLFFFFQLLQVVFIYFMFKTLKNLTQL